MTGDPSTVARAHGLNLELPPPRNQRGAVAATVRPRVASCVDGPNNDRLRDARQQFGISCNMLMQTMLLLLVVLPPATVPNEAWLFSIVPRLQLR